MPPRPRASSGPVWSLGFPDGDAVGCDTAIAVLARVVKAVDVPVTADIESGSGDLLLGRGLRVHLDLAVSHAWSRRSTSRSPPTSSPGPAIAYSAGAFA
jgi:hypothetical protein